MSRGKADSETKVAATETKRVQKSGEKEFVLEDEGHLDLQVSGEDAADAAEEAIFFAKKS